MGCLAGGAQCLRTTINWKFLKLLLDRQANQPSISSWKQVSLLFQVVQIGADMVQQEVMEVYCFPEADILPLHALFHLHSQVPVGSTIVGASEATQG